MGDFGSVGGRQSRACFYLQYELRLADQRVQQIKMVADHPLLSSAGTDNEAQGGSKGTDGQPFSPPAL